VRHFQAFVAGVALIIVVWFIAPCRIIRRLSLVYSYSAFQLILWYFVCISDYLCSPEANVYDIDFTRFKIRDLETGTVLFEIAKPPPTGISNSFMHYVCTGWHKKTGTFEKPNKNWRNPRKKIYWHKLNH